MREQSPVPVSESAIKFALTMFLIRALVFGGGMRADARLGMGTDHAWPRPSSLECVARNVSVL